MYRRAIVKNDTVEINAKGNLLIGILDYFCTAFKLVRLYFKRTLRPRLRPQQFFDRLRGKATYVTDMTIILQKPTLYSFG